MSTAGRRIWAQSRNNFLINLVLDGLIAWFLLKDGYSGGTRGAAGDPDRIARDALNPF